MTPLAVSGVLAGGQVLSGLLGGVLGARSAKKAAKIMANAVIKATRMQLDALDRARNIIMTTLDPERLQRDVLQYDIDNVKNRLALLQEIDPYLYSVRQSSSRALAELARQPSLYLKEAAPNEYSKQLDEVQNLLLQRAKENLQLGGQLSPEVQSEIVQAGLERVGAAGLRPSAGGKYGAAGPTVARMLGTAGEQLRQAREQLAQRSLEAAQRSHEEHGSYLARLLGAETGLQTGLGGYVQGMTPQAGLTGGDVLNLLVQRAYDIAGLYGAQGRALSEQARSLGEIHSQAQQQAAGAWIASLGKMFEGLGDIFSKYLPTKTQ